VRTVLGRGTNDTYRKYYRVIIKINYCIIKENKYCKRTLAQGEIIGAKLYIAETLKQPNKYIYSIIILIANGLGSALALGVASLSLSLAFDWRVAFWIGAIIALMGLAARTRLRKTPEFVDYKRRLKIKQAIINTTGYGKAYAGNSIDKKLILAYFVTRLVGPICFYVAYIYSASSPVTPVTPVCCFLHPSDSLARDAQQEKGVSSWGLVAGG
jgi:MFS family permease